MFDWLFENRVKGTLYFKETCGKHLEHLYTEALNKLMEVRGITLRAEGVVVYWHYLATHLVPEELWKDCDLQLDMDLINVENAEEIYENGGEIPFRIEVDCWEGAWKELEKLPWVTGTEKAL